MNIDKYQEWTRVTAIYPKDRAMEYLILGLCSEAGEVAGKFKKVIRDNGGVINEVVRKAILEEIGDVHWYMARIIDELGASSLDTICENHDKLESRRQRNVLGGSGDHR